MGIRSACFVQVQDLLNCDYGEGIAVITDKGVRNTRGVSCVAFAKDVVELVDSSTVS